jgi:hypothetical protein
MATSPQYSPGQSPIQSPEQLSGEETHARPTVVRFGFDVLDRVEQAVAMVKERLKRSVSALEAAGVPYAVAGGHAVAAWVSRIDPAAVRTTVDVDILIARVDFDRARAALEAVGFIHSFTFGIDIIVDGPQVFVDGPEGKAREAVHIIFAGERVKPGDSVPAPDLSATAAFEGYKIVEFDRLLVMKLTAFRDKDRTHLRDMIDVGLIDTATLERLPPELRPRLEQLLNNPDG